MHPGILIWFQVSIFTLIIMDLFSLVPFGTEILEGNQTIKAHNTGVDMGNERGMSYQTSDLSMPIKKTDFETLNIQENNDD